MTGAALAAGRLLPAGGDACSRSRSAPTRGCSARIGGGALWIAALTAALLPIERLIEPDRADGVLDQLALHGVAEESVAAAKIAAHWLTFGPLLLIAAIPAAALLAMDGAVARPHRDRARDRHARPRRAGRRGRRADRRPAARRRARRPAAAAARRAAADLRRGSDGGRSRLLLEAAVSLLLTAGAPFVAGAAIRAART